MASATEDTADKTESQGESLQPVMTDTDLETALEALEAQGGNEDVAELLKAMNENRIISWEEAEQIMSTTQETNYVKCGLPEHVRPTEPENDTDAESCIQRLLKNDPTLKEVNLNNMKRTPIPQIQRLIMAVKENTNLKKLSLANTALSDTGVEPLIEVLETNSTLESVNLETNYLSGDTLARILKAALKLQTLQEFKAVNQSPTFSTQAEREIMEAVFNNKGLLKVSINLRLPEGRSKIEQSMIRNGELKRLKRKMEAQQKGASS